MEPLQSSMASSGSASQRCPDRPRPRAKSCKTLQSHGPRSSSTVFATRRNVAAASLGVHSTRPTRIATPLWLSSSPSLSSHASAQCTAGVSLAWISKWLVSTLTLTCPATRALPRA
jgi:hypothetical protein